jgi:hypothetical protein
MALGAIGMVAPGTDELFGDVGLALQPGKSQRPIHRHHQLATLQPLAHGGDHLTIGGAFCSSAQVGIMSSPARISSSVRSG